MEYSELFTEGFFRYCIFLALMLAFFGALEILPMYLILKRTDNRHIRLLLPAMVLLPGFILLMHFDLDLLILASFLVVGPVAALMPNCILPELTPPGLRFARVMICYLAVTLFGIVVVLAYFWPARSLVREFFLHTPVSNVIIYACIVALDTGFSFLSTCSLLHFGKARGEGNREKPVSSVSGRKIYGVVFRSAYLSSVRSERGVARLSQGRGG